jgi:alkylation response protein AidB-like acyl-CoA dehydrogenase
MPNFTQEQLDLFDTARKVVAERIEPIARRIEASGEHPDDLTELYRSLGWSSITKPAEYGGAGGGVTEWCLLMEAVSEASLACAHMLTHPSLYLLVDKLGTPVQKEKFFALLDHRSSAFMASEAEAGSDVGAIRTTAVERDGCYVLSGRKNWISNGAYADLFAVVASVDLAMGAKGLRVFLVDTRESRGVVVERQEDLMGLRGSSVAQVLLDNVEVPAGNLLVRQGGTRDFVEFITATRPHVGAQAVGVATGAMRCALSYTLGRRQFGQPVFEFQAVSHMIADMAIQIEAARELVYAAAAESDRQGERRGEIAAMCKVFASDMAMRVTTDAVQCLGGAGYSREYPVERMMRDAKVLQIYEGSTQVLRGQIATQLARRLGR